MFANAPRSITAGLALLFALIAVLLLPSPGSRVQAAQTSWIDAAGGPLTGGSRTYAIAVDVAVDGQGYAYVTGHTTVALPGQTSSGRLDGFVRKYDVATGVIIWTRQFGHPVGTIFETEGIGIAVHQSPAGVAVYVAGDQDNRMSLRKFDGDGNELWTWTLEGQSFGLSRGADVAIDAAGDPFIVGNAVVDGVPMGVIAQVTQAGISPARHFLSAQGGANLALTSAAFTSSGRLVVGGFTEGALVLPGGSLAGASAGGRDAFLVQLSLGAGLTAEWAAQFGSSLRDEATDIAIAPDDAVYVVGFEQDSFNASGSFVRKYDPSGSLLWSRGHGVSSVQRRYCGVSVNPVSGSVHVVGTADRGVSRPWPCESSTYLPGYYGPGASTSFSMFLHSFDAEGFELLSDEFGVPVTADAWTEASHTNMPTGLGVAHYGDSVVVVGNTQTSNSPAFTCQTHELICPASYGGDYAFVMRRDGLPRGRIDVRTDTPSVTTYRYQPVTITGTYDDRNGVTPVLSGGAFATLTQNGGASGTWSATFSSPSAGVTGFSLVAEDSLGVRTILPIEVHVEALIPPIVHAFTDSVVVVGGETATMTGTYHDPTGGTPTLTAKVGLTPWPLATSGGSTGTWSFSLPTSLRTQIVTDTVTVTAANAHDPQLASSASFQVVQLPFAPPNVSVAENAVAVAPGGTAANSGTYFHLRGTTPILTASEGTITQSGGATGTWSWSRPTDASYTGSSVTITATDGELGLANHVSFDVAVQTASVAVTSSHNPSVLGTIEHFEVQLTSLVDGLPPPTGDVQFAIDGAVVSTQPLGDSGYTFFGSSFAAPGTHVVDVIYAGDEVHRPARGSLVQTVAAAAVVQAGPWTRQFGTGGADEARAAAADPAGGIYVAGASSGDAFLRKYDAEGAVLWAASIATAASGVAHGVATDALGDVYVVGETSAALPDQLSTGHRDAFIRKYDSAGVEQWTRQFGSQSDDAAYGVAVDPAGSVYVVGTTYQQLPGQIAQGGVDAFIRRYDAAGTEVWTRQFGTNTTDELSDVAVDGAGRIVVTGYTGGTLFDQTAFGDDDVLVAQWNGDGTLLWMRQYGGSGIERGHGVATDAAGNVYVAGYNLFGLPGQPSGGAHDAFVRKYDVLGTGQWTRAFGVSGGDFAHDVAVDRDGRVLVAGQSPDGAFVQSFLGDGTAGTRRQFGPPNTISAAIGVDTAGAVIVAGSVVGALPGLAAAGGQDAFVARFVDEAAPVVTLHPIAATATLGGGVSFLAKASPGTPLARVQWQVSTDGGATFSNGDEQRVVTDYVDGIRTYYTFVPDLAETGHHYRAVFTNTSGSVTTAAATLTVLPADIVLTAQQAHVTVMVGQPATNGGTYGDPNGVTPTLAASAGTVVTAGGASGAWTWTLATTEPMDAELVTITATDSLGATGTATFTLTVLGDQTPPVITTSGDTTIEATGPSGAVATFTASATDAVDGSRPVTCAPASGATFALGTTTVTCSAADASGHVGTATLRVNVIDSTPPDVSIISPRTDDELSAPQIAVYLHAPDLVGVALVRVNGVAGVRTGGPQSSSWQVGVPVVPGSPVTFVAEAVDLAGNVGTARVAVDSDGIDGTIDRNPVTDADETGIFSNGFRKGATFGTIVDRGSWRINVRDLAATPWVRANISGPAGPAARIAVCDGVYKEIRLDGNSEHVQWRCDGASGTVTVTALFANPAVELFKSTCATEACGLSFVAAIASGDTLTTGSPFVADPGNSQPILVTILDGSQAPLGSFTLDPGDAADVMAAVGANGEEQLVLDTLEGDVTFEVAGRTIAVSEDDPPVVVSEDQTPPAIAAAVNVTAEATSADGAVVTFALPIVADDTDPSPAITVSHGSGSLFPLGETTVTITATDDAGNSAAATFTVTVQDTTAPVLTVPGPMTAVAEGPDGAVVTFQPTATEVVSAATVTCTPPSGTTFPIGTTTVTCTATDAAGNAATAAIAVQVTDPATPGLMHGGGHVMSGPVRYDFNFSALELANGRVWGSFTLQVCQPEPPRRRGRKDHADEHARCVGGGDRFTARTFTFARFDNDPSFEPGRGRSQAALPDTLVLAGVGAWNGIAGYGFEVRATDQGEPGRNRDRFEVTIRTPGGAVVAAVDGRLASGNVQSTPGVRWRNR